MHMPPSEKKKLGLAIDSWKFLEDLSPVRHESPPENPAPEDISDQIELLQLRRALAAESQIRSEISSRLDVLESRAGNFFPELLRSYEEISDQLARTREVLRRVGELSMEFPGPIRSEIVSLCASLQISIGPCIQISGCSGLPRLRIYEDEDSDLEISFDLCSDDGTVCASVLHRGPRNFQHQNISLPIALLPSQATSCMLQISDRSSSHFRSSNYPIIAHTPLLEIDSLFAQEISVQLFRNALPIPNAFLLIHPQSFTPSPTHPPGNFYSLEIRDLEISQNLNPDSLELSIFISALNETKKFPLNRMHSKHVASVPQGSKLNFRLSHISDSSLIATGSVLALLQTSLCDLNDSSGNLIARLAIDFHPPSIRN